CAPAAAQKVFDASSHTNVTDSHHTDGGIMAARFGMDGGTGSQIGDGQIIQNILAYTIEEDLACDCLRTAGLRLNTERRFSSFQADSGDGQLNSLCTLSFVVFQSGKYASSSRLWPLESPGLVITPPKWTRMRDGKMMASSRSGQSSVIAVWQKFSDTVYGYRSGDDEEDHCSIGRNLHIENTKFGSHLIQSVCHFVKPGLQKYVDVRMREACTRVVWIGDAEKQGRECQQ
ncbi:hypothetical protein B0H10DRAFT_1957826, partial [Mycena sp. CBHHK59/15]